MTIPTVIVTTEGGIVTGVCADKQVNVIVLDADDSGIEVRHCRFGYAGFMAYPSDTDDAWIREVLKAIDEDPR